MATFYLQIKWIHVWAVVLSGTLLFLRGLAAHMGAQWTMAWPLRGLSYAIDTVLLTAALMLMSIVRQYPFADSWLTVKVLLIVLYVVLGSYALKRGATRVQRISCGVAAIVVYVFVIGVARTHDPLGPLRNPSAFDLQERPLISAPGF